MRQGDGGLSSYLLNDQYRRLIGKTEMIGVEDGDGWILYAPLEA